MIFFKESAFLPSSLSSLTFNHSTLHFASRIDNTLQMGAAGGQSQSSCPPAPGRSTDSPAACQQRLKS